MASTKEDISRTRSLDDVRVLILFFASGLVCGFIFAWIISRPGLRGFWYVKGDKFLIPRLSYWTAFGLIFLVGPVIAYGLGRWRRWLLADVTASYLLLAALLVGASPPALYYVGSFLESTSWDIEVAPVAFIALLSLAVCMATRTLRLLPIVFVWNGVFLAAGIAIIYLVVKFVDPPGNLYEFIQWPVLESMLALSLGSWVIWHERLVARKIVGGGRVRNRGNNDALNSK